MTNTEPNQNGEVWDPRLRQWVEPGRVSEDAEVEWDGQKWVVPGTTRSPFTSTDRDETVEITNHQDDRTVTAQHTAQAAPAPGRDTQPQVEGEGETEGRYVPGDHTVAEVLKYIEDHPEDRRRVLRNEQRNKARSGILEHA